MDFEQSKVAQPRLVIYAIVNAAAQWYDEKQPGWWREVDLVQLEDRRFGGLKPIFLLPETMRATYNANRGGESAETQVILSDALTCNIRLYRTKFITVCDEWAQAVRRRDE